MRILRPLVALALLLAPSLSDAQGTVGGARVPNRPASDNSTAPANTAYVDAAVQVLLSTINSKASLNSPTFTGTPTAPTASAGSSSAQIASTAFVAGAVATEAARAQTAEGLLAPLVSPTFTGAPTAPTPTAGDNSTRLATTAFVTASFLAKTDAASTYAALTSPAFTGTPSAPTAAPGTSTTQLATTAFTGAAVATEATRAQAAEALLAPMASPILSGPVTISTGGSVLIKGPAGANQDKTLLVGSNGTLQIQNGSGQTVIQIDDAGNVYVANAAQYVIQGLPIIGPRQPAVMKATDASDVVATVNAVIDRMVSHGLIYPNP